MDLKDLRNQIDEIDNSLVELFVKRMEISAQVADYKKANNLPIYVPAREREILQEVAAKAGSEMANYARVLYTMLFELSRSYQRKRNTETTPLYQTITRSIENTDKLFPQAPMVACQGVEGAYSQIACEKVFKAPFIMYFKNFDGVFNAIEQGLCHIVILTFQSLEDRIVKEAFRYLENPCRCPSSFPTCVCGKKPEIKIITKKPITACETELEDNSRSKCAKLRIAEKL